MNWSLEEPSRRNTDFPVGAPRRLKGQRHLPQPRRGLENRLYAAGRLLALTKEALLAFLTPCPAWRRYRVAPRANPAAFRHELLCGIQRELCGNADFPVGPCPRDLADWKTAVTPLSSMTGYSKC